MRYIESVRISKFRSVGPNETFESLGLNIFSGSNDSGKSNILKSLNLFFTGQSELNIRYNPETDFNKWFRDNNVRGERNIEIELKIAKGNYGDTEGINEGFSAKKIFRIDGGQETKFYGKDGDELKPDSKSFSRANGVISEKIRFVYIPAIRDLKFRESIQRLIEEIANSTDKRFKSQDLKDAFVKMESGIDSQLKELTTSVKELMNIDIEANVNFSTLLESLAFETSEKIKIKKRGKGKEEIQKVSLRNRGDGIQMQFFSFLLWFISKNDKKHFYVWGFEEPEIAFEFKRQFELADIFQSTFRKVAQIFLTTHSPAFALSEANDSTTVFRVNYEKDKSTKSDRYNSKVIPINEYYEGLFKDLTNSSSENKKMLERDIWGINAQKISKMIGESMAEIVGVRHISNNQLEELKNLIASQQQENTDLKTKVDNISKDLKNLFPKKVFICEDSTSISLWENLLFDKLGIGRTDFKVISSKGCTNTEVEAALLHLIKEDNTYKPQIFRQLDRDGFTTKQVTFLETRKIENSNYKKFKQYVVKFLPVNEIENFAVLTDSYYTEDKLKDYEVNIKITDAFNQTVKSSIQNALKLCKEEDERKLFLNKEAEMIKEARSSLLKLFPGKDIKKIKSNFNCDTILKNKNYSELPLEFQNYLKEIKNYFEPPTT
ncbi:MAG: AAA family ATPase [Pedobacter sp.]|uniref:ATP-dependent nuclease n=1 Tax=Pedobacter sp. TaxID=1411316 RepID=UPI0028090044|nr:AAA family ATPase [Pedobacter sp.]MDQ8004953.1 AAA family ATPase [Pedobacter sp.]